MQEPKSIQENTSGAVMLQRSIAILDISGKPISVLSYQKLATFFSRGLSSRDLKRLKEMVVMIAGFFVQVEEQQRQTNYVREERASSIGRQFVQVLESLKRCYPTHSNVIEALNYPTKASLARKKKNTNTSLLRKFEEGKKNFRVYSEAWQAGMNF